MTKSPIILVIGTFDTKDEELNYLCARIRAQGAEVLTMDVSVLGNPSQPTNISKAEVAAAAGRTIDEAMTAEDENVAMQIMAAGAAMLTAKLHAEGRIQGMIALGGTMGTDLALDCARALPIGVPKYVVSTIAFSALIPPDRLSADIQMILWAGGLYGLNDICKATLSQAAGAVVGAARAVEPPNPDRPVIGMMSFGSSALKYMIHLRQPLIDRGFSVAVFHGTGMGGMAMESLAEQGFGKQDARAHGEGEQHKGDPDQPEQQGFHGQQRWQRGKGPRANKIKGPRQTFYASVNTLQIR